MTSSSNSSRRKRSSDTPVTNNTNNDTNDKNESLKGAPLKLANADAESDCDADSDTSTIMNASNAVPNSNAAKHAAKPKLRIRIKSFHGVAKWTWNVGNGSDDEVCGICQSAFEGCPPGVKYPGDESPVVFGTCGEWVVTSV